MAKAQLILKKEVMENFTNLSLKQYLQELSSEKPVPGGGSVSAYVAALAMGLIQMVGRVALKRKPKQGLSAVESRKDQERRQAIQKVIDSLEKPKQDAFQIVDLDPQVYESVMQAWNDPAKQGDALKNSFRLQADLALLVVMARQGVKALADLVSGSIKNDLVVSAHLLEAAFQGAYHTALINVVYMKDAKQKERSEKALEELKMKFEKEKINAR